MLFEKYYGIKLVLYYDAKLMKLSGTYKKILEKIQDKVRNRNKT